MRNLDDGLGRCLADWREHGPAAIQLRGADLFTQPSLDDDTDVLMAPEAVAQLLQRARRWTVAGWCHTQVVTRRPHKTEVTLHALDGTQRVVLDVWRRVPQIDRGRRSLTFAGCTGACACPESPVMRLPILTEAWVYLHHLQAKRKDLSADSVQSRLAGYVQALQGTDGPAGMGTAAEVDQHAWAAKIDAVREQRSLDPAVLDAALRGLDAAVTLAGPPRQKLGQLWGRVFLAPPRVHRLVCVMGCDGAGKTSLAGALATRVPAIQRVFTGKHLYRKSYLFKLLVIFVRPLLGQSRERFDERMAPLVYLRACWGLRIKHWRRQQLVIDRTLTDFLYLDRKTDRPRFSCWRWLAAVAGLRVPVVHCMVDFDQVASRKELEVTRSGHAAYDRDMFEALAGRVPGAYLAFNNNGALEESSAALERILRRERGWGR